jgi:hypothetical protein
MLVPWLVPGSLVDAVVAPGSLGTFCLAAGSGSVSRGCSTDGLWGGSGNGCSRYDVGSQSVPEVFLVIAGRQGVWLYD